MPIDTIRLNCTNFFTYFAFHPNDKQLNSKDRKTAKVATVLFAFSIIGHAICRLFAYKKIVATYTKTINKTQSESKKHFSKKVESDIKKESEKNSSSQAQSKETSSEQSVSDAKKPRSTCKFVLKEIMNEKSDSKSPPSLFSLSLDIEHPAIEKMDFQTAFGQEEAYKHFQNTPLMNWPFLSKTACGKFTNNPKNAIKKLDALVEERLAQFQECFQIKERIQLLKEKDHLQYLTMQDLEHSFQSSPLAIAICSKDDLAKIDFSISHSDKVLAMIKHRLPTLEQVPVDNIPNNLAELTVQQLHSLTGEQLSNIIDVLPLEAVQLISDEQIQEMEFSRLEAESKEHQKIFNTLFPIPTKSKDSRLDLLTIDQVKSCWHMLGEDHISLLSDEILQEIDFNKYPVTKKQFDALFPSYRKLADPIYERYASRIKLLSIDQIEACWDYFSDVHTSYFSDKQITNLPLNAFNPSDKADKLRFSGIFYSPGFKSSEAARKMGLLSLEQVQAYWTLFKTNIVFITPKQLGDIYFHEYPLKQKQFDALFGIISQDTPRNNIKASRVKELSMQQIYDCWVLFDLKTLGYLSDSQVKKLEYSMFNDRRYLRAIFGDLTRFDHIGVERMALLDKDQLEECWDILDNDLFSLFSKEQVEKLTPHLSLNQEQFDYLFPKQLGDKPWESSKVQYLSMDMISKNFEYFDADRIQYLTLDQLKALDFSAFRTKKGKDLIQSLFSAATISDFDRACERYKALDFDQRSVVQDMVEKDIWQALERKA